MEMMKQGRPLPTQLLSIMALLAMVSICSSSSEAMAATSVQLTSPTNNALISGTITLSCTVSSNVEWINIDVNGSYYASGSEYETSYTTSWNSANVPNGEHSVQCNGYGSNGALLGNSIAYITVSNSLTSPTPTPVSTPTATPTSTPTPKASPTPIGCTTIPGTSTTVGAACLPATLFPTLKNPHDPVSYGADKTGSKDSTNAINAALAAGDANFSTPGTYLVSLSTGHGVVPPAGRTIECVRGVTFVEHAESSNGGSDVGILSLENGGNTVVGCNFEGGNSATGAVDIGSNQGQFLIIVSSSNNTIEGNSFQNTWGNSAVQVNSDYTGITPANFLVQYNTFSHNAYYGPEVDVAASGTIQNNLQIDGGMGPEDDSCSSSNAVKNVIIKNNELKVSAGDCYTAGDSGCDSSAFITGGSYPPGCNYSTVTVANNYCQGNGTQAAEIENGGSGVTSGSYSNDILGPGCSCESGSHC
jgi:Bacterial Ig domain